MVRAVLWDNDGVLVDSEQIFYEANRAYFARHAVDLTQRDFFEWFLVQDCGAWNILAAQGMSGEQVAHCKAERNALYMQRLLAGQPPATPGIEDILAALHTRVPMAVVTSSSPEHFATIHRESGLMRYFDFVLTADRYERAKPAPDPYLKALEILNLSPDECVAVEDSPRGLAAARAAGVDCIVLRTALAGDYAFPGACRIVDSVAELSAVLEGMTCLP